MPPIRTYSSVKPVQSIKPAKTERTHEENQERAYIAASRRSDRSLEARVESARRASEIHKRRTGRSLRVTEQDVINEEMYEEEDDDLPAQYRRLTAHMNSGSSDFNRRLTAYLSNHVAMRNALNQALSNSYQQYPNGTPWAQNMQAIHSPNGNQMNAQQQQPYENSPMVFPMLYNSNPPFRQTPYPLPSPQPFRQQPGHNSLSPSTAQADSHDASNKLSDNPDSSKSDTARRASEPLLSESDAKQAAKDLGKSASTSPSVTRAALSNREATVSPGEFQGQRLSAANPQYPPTPSSYRHPLALQKSDKPHMDSLGPLSTAMPPETQMFAGAGFDPNDPFGYRLWNDSKNQTYANKHPLLQGMNQTLAPGGLDVDSRNNYMSDVPFSAPPFSYTFSDAFNKDSSYSEGDEESGQLTPTEGDWASLIDQSTWEESTTQPN